MKRHLYILVLALIVLSGSVTAQDTAPSPTPSPTPPVNDVQKVQPENLEGVPEVAPAYRSDDRTLPDLGRVGVDMTEQKPLTLNEAITMALENNKDIEVTRQNVKGAEFDLEAFRGVYEPRFTGQTFYERATVPNISFFTPTITTTTTNNIVGNASLQAFLPKYGTIFTGTFNNTRAASDNPVSIISPQYNSSISFGVQQPLFRGRKFDLNRRNIEVAKKNLSLTDTQFRQRTIEVITNVQRAYWDLTYALRNLQVQRDGVRDAKTQLDHNKRLAEEGQLAPIDVIAAETQVANFEQTVYEALNNVTIAENNLKNLISPNRNDRIWGESVTPVDPVSLTPPATTLTQELAIALQNRPELELNETQKEINRLDQRYYKEQTKPQIDLTASYTSAGVGGSLNPNFTNPLLSGCVQDPTQTQCQTAAANQQALLQSVGAGGTAYTDMLTNKYPTYKVGVTFNLPLFGDKTANAQLGKSLVEGEKLETQREQLEQNIQVDVRNALQALRTAEARLRAAAIARENSVKQYDSEQRKLDAGQSDVYKVLERQTALTTARSNELRAQTELNKAIADLQRATGSSLKANNIEARLRR